MTNQHLILWIFVTLVTLLGAPPLGALMVLHMFIYLIYKSLVKKNQEPTK